jgi:hypothetical protein
MIGSQIDSIVAIQAPCWLALWLAQAHMSTSSIRGIPPMRKSSTRYICVGLLPLLRPTWHVLATRTLHLAIPHLQGISLFFYLHSHLRHERIIPTRTTAIVNGLQRRTIFNPKCALKVSSIYLDHDSMQRDSTLLGKAN